MIFLLVVEQKPLRRPPEVSRHMFLHRLTACSTSLSSSTSPFSSFTTSFSSLLLHFSTSAKLRMDKVPPRKRRRSSEEKDGGGSKDAVLRDGGRDKDPGQPRSKEGEREAPKGGEDSTSSYSAPQDKPWPLSCSPAPDGKPHPLSRGRSSGEELIPSQRQEGGGQWPLPPRSSEPIRPLQRSWEWCSSVLHPPGGAAAAASSFLDFSILSYNILSQELLQDNAYLYRHCPPDALRWKQRLPLLLQELKELQADILCLQEVQQDHYENQIKPALQTLGYHCEYKKRTGSKPDGVAVAFRSSRFSLLSSSPVEFLRPGDPLLDRDNVGLVLLLQPCVEGGTSICVANTHLLYNPRRGDVKLAQLAILLAETDRLSRLRDGSTNPVLLCGDFNSAPWSPLYRLLTTGCLNYRGLQIGMVSGQEDNPRGQRLLVPPLWSPSLGINQQCQYQTTEGAISNLSVDNNAQSATKRSRTRLEHRLRLKSTYRHRLMPDGRSEVTTCHSRTAMTVDYILYSADFLSPPGVPGGRGLQLLGRLSLVGQPELEAVGGLPNQHHPSDHLPLLARFRLTL